MPEHDLEYFRSHQPVSDNYFQSPKNNSQVKRNLIIIGLGIAVLSIIVALFALTRPANKFPANPVVTQATPSSNVATAPATPPVAPVDPTTGWTAYSNPTGHYSLKYNPAWKTKTCPDSPATLFLAPNAAALGACQSDFGGQMQVLSMNGDQRASLRYGSNYDSVTTTSVTIGGVAGERQTAVAKAPAALGPPAGTKLVQYIIFNGTRTYLATYQQQPSGDVSTDVLSDFDLVVKNTLTFS